MSARTSPRSHPVRLEEADIVAALAALAQAHRLRAFRALVVAGRSGLTPGTLAVGLGITPSALSFHLKALMHAGLVMQERHGRFLVCRVAFDRMNGLLAYLGENCSSEACADPSGRDAGRT